MRHVRLFYAKRRLLSFLLDGTFGSGHPVTDLSRTGVHFLTDEELKAGLHLKAALRLSTEEAPVRFDADVVWVGPGDKHHAYSVAIRSTGYYDQSWHRLWEFIEASAKEAERENQEEPVGRGRFRRTRRRSPSRPSEDT